MPRTRPPRMDAAILTARNHRAAGGGPADDCDKDLKEKMARETGLEPATSGVTGRRSNQLSYSPARVGGG